MAWVAAQKFAQSSRRFVVNTNLSSRSWFIWRWRDDDEDDEGGASASTEKHRKTLSYTPSFGSHVFWYRGRLLLFQRTQNRNQMYFTPASEVSVKHRGGVSGELIMEVLTNPYP